LVWVWSYKDVAPTALNMRSALGKELRKQFALEMSRTLPEYVEIKIPPTRPGARMYVQRTPQISFFILMWPFPTGDWFGIMYGWSSSGERPIENYKYNPEHERNLLTHDGCLFRITRVRNEAGGTEDRFWVLEDAMGVAFERTLQEFAKPGDTPIQTLERATNEGTRYILSTYRETAVEKLLPKIPNLVKDCVKYIRETVISYFKKISELKSHA
jgi:hypothetical protein